MTTASKSQPRQTANGGQKNEVIRLRPDNIDVDAGTVREMLAELQQQHLRRSDGGFQLQLEAVEDLFLTLHSMTLTDELTHLYNRRGFLRAGAQLLAALGDDTHRALLLYFDVNNLKLVNDSLGHAAGDALLTLSLIHI